MTDELPSVSHPSKRCNPEVLRKCVRVSWLREAGKIISLCFTSPEIHIKNN